LEAVTPPAPQPPVERLPPDRVSFEGSGDAPRLPRPDVIDAFTLFALLLREGVDGEGQ
jgi:hypothetical protein